jgi:glycosyltransferase involved in cell wall biosynthesis
MEATSPVVDVVLPVYNGASTVKESVDSVRAQTIQDIRIIIVDDGSTDDTPKVLAELAREDSRVHLLRKSNGGIIETLNFGLAHCRAEFVARQDADDLSDPIRLAAQVDFLRTHQDCVAVSCGARHIDVHGESTGHVAFGSRGGSTDPYWIPAREPYLLHPFLMLRRSILERAGNYRYVYNAEDTDLYWRLRELGRIDIDNKVLGSYRMHDQSISGGSVLNGRIMALGSQLAALSARRRKSNRPDILFRKEAVDEYRKAGSLQGICAAAQKNLDAEEAAYLRIATCAKLLQMEAYRPYDLEIDDARFIHDTYVQNELFSPKQLAEFRYLISTAAARLLENGALREAIALTPRPLAVEVCLRFLALYLPQSLYRAGVRLRR